MASEHGLAQHRHRGSDAVEYVEDRRECGLDGAEAALHGGLLRRSALALRRMLDADRVVRLLRGLGEVRRALIGDELHALASGDCVADRAGDQRIGLTHVDGERVVQAALAIADVLNSDELEVDAEDTQVGGVTAELGVGCRCLEREATGVAVWARRTRRLGWWRRRRRLGRSVLPRAERALGQRERVAERARGHSVIAVHTV